LATMCLPLYISCCVSSSVDLDWPLWICCLYLDLEICMSDTVYQQLNIH
jgi:hypothetical protein